MWHRLLPLLILGCGPEISTGSPCSQATHHFLDCGVSVPILNDGPCVGLKHAVAECVLDYTESCETIADLTQEPNLCFERLLDPPAPIDSPVSLFPETPEPWEAGKEN